MTSSRFVYFASIGYITLTVAGFISLKANLNGSAEMTDTVFSSSYSAIFLISLFLSSRQRRIG